MTQTELLLPRLKLSQSGFEYDVLPALASKKMGFLGRPGLYAVLVQQTYAKARDKTNEKPDVQSMDTEVGGSTGKVVLELAPDTYSKSARNVSLLKNHSLYPEPL